MSQRAHDPAPLQLETGGFGRPFALLADVGNHVDFDHDVA